VYPIQTLQISKGLHPDLFELFLLPGFGVWESFSVIGLQVPPQHSDLVLSDTMAFIPGSTVRNKIYKGNMKANIFIRNVS